MDPILFRQVIDDGAALGQCLDATYAALDVGLCGHAAVFEAPQQVLEALELAELPVEAFFLGAKPVEKARHVTVGDDVFDFVEGETEALKQLNGVECFALCERVVAISRLVVTTRGHKQAFFVIDAQGARRHAIELCHRAHREPVWISNRIACSGFLLMQGVGWCARIPWLSLSGRGAPASLDSFVFHPAPPLAV